MQSSVDHGVRVAAVTLLLAGAGLLAWEFAHVRRRPDRSVVRRWLALVAIVWSAAAGLELKVSAPAAVRTSDSDEIDALAGMLATAVIAHVLTRRREQMRERFMPDRLTVEETRLLTRFVEESSPVGAANPNVDLATHDDPRVHVIVDAVDRPMVPPADPAAIEEWRALLRVYGAPRVETTDGRVIEYRKSRALELTAWLAFNRDRRSRSAARTAIWDIDVSDATFSTVVSDLRRALSTVDPGTSTAEWLPTTYTDEIELSGRVTTDADLLRSAFATFEKNPDPESDLYRVLSLVRDVPFAGTRWSWADLDGTTTRLVILAVDASIAAASFASRIGRPDLLEIATTAGFRVMPGCPELVSIQQSFLSHLSMSH